LVAGADRGIGMALVESFLDHGTSKVCAACRTLEPVKAAFGDRLAPQTKKGRIVNVAIRHCHSSPIGSELPRSDPMKRHDRRDRDETYAPRRREVIESLQYETSISVYGFLFCGWPGRLLPFWKPAAEPASLRRGTRSRRRGVPSPGHRPTASARA